MRLHYQITGEPTVDVPADVIVLDLFDTEPAQVTAARALGRVVIAYTSAGSWEPWRSDADEFPARVVGMPLASYPNEKWLDIRSPSVRSLMAARLQLARNKGFDGIFPGALAAYRAESGFPLTEADQIDFDVFLATETRRLGMTPGLSDFVLAPSLADAFDWGISVGCLAANSCELLRPLLDRKKAVFDLEIRGELADLCARGRMLGISVTLKRADFDAWSMSCP